MLSKWTMGIVASALTVGSALVTPANAGAIDLTRQRPPIRSLVRISEGSNTLAPFAYIRFCVDNPDDCRPSAPTTVSWDKPTRALIASANRRVNHSIRAVNEAGDRWTAGRKSGDCEDFALTKRRDLLALGIPGSALRMAVALTPSGEGHAVLVVSTNDGDVVLDNRFDRILAWHKTDLSWLKIASADNPKIWRSVY